MSEGLFRAEAVAYHERGLGPGNLLRHPAWVRWAFWAMFLALVGALVASVALRVSTTVTAPLRLDPTNGAPSVLVTASGHGALRPGLSVTTSDGRRGTVTAVKPVPERDAVRGPELVVRVTLDRPGSGDATGTIHLPAERLALFVFPGLRGWLGE